MISVNDRTWKKIQPVSALCKSNIQEDNQNFLCGPSYLLKTVADGDSDN